MNDQEYIDFIVSNLLNDLDREVSSKKSNSIGFEEILKDLFYGDSFNFYPADNHVACCKLAFFVSLTSKKWPLKPSSKISFGSIMQQFIRHMQGNCKGITKTAVIITDNLELDKLNFWEMNIEQIRNSGVDIQLKVITSSGPYSIRP